MIKIHKSKDKQFYFTVTSSNGMVLATSETYKKKSSAVRGAKAAIRTFSSFKLKIVDLT